MVNLSNSLWVIYYVWIAHTQRRSGLNKITRCASVCLYRCCRDRYELHGRYYWSLVQNFVVIKPKMRVFYALSIIFLLWHIHSYNHFEPVFLPSSRFIVNFCWINFPFSVPYILSNKRLKPVFSLQMFQCVISLSFRLPIWGKTCGGKPVPWGRFSSTWIFSRGCHWIIVPSLPVYRL